LSLIVHGGGAAADGGTGTGFSRIYRFSEGLHSLSYQDVVVSLPTFKLARNASGSLRFTKRRTLSP